MDALVCKRSVRCLMLLAALVLADTASGLAAAPRAGQLTAGGGLGIMGATPDGTAFTLYGRVEQFISPNISIGPLVQLGFTGDLFLIGLSGQFKYWIDLPDTARRLKANVQAGFGFVYANVGDPDTSWLLPLGVGLDYAMTSQVSLTADFLLNFTNLDINPNHTANVMPTVTVGLRF